MSRRSLNRDILDAKMNNNPDQRAVLLTGSKHNRHRRLALEMHKRIAAAVAKAKEVVDKVED